MALSKEALPRDANYVPIHDSIGQILGIPHVGNIFYVDPTNGADTNSGIRYNNAFATLTAAEDKMTAYNHDVVVILPGGTSGTGESATITWDKDYCHILGATAPSHFSNRSRVLWTTDSVDPCLTMSANGCIFKNIQLATYQASNDVLVNLTGDRNRFEDMHFAGIGHATAGDDSTARHIAMTGAVNNKFSNCVIGDDTIARSTSNASVSFASGSSKNLFEDCYFVMNADNVGALFVSSSGTGGISGINEFKNCTWVAKWTNAADKITAAFDISAQTQTCIVLMSGSHLLVGADDWEASASGYMWFPQVIDTNPGTYAGLGVNNVQ